MYVAYDESTYVVKAVENVPTFCDDTYMAENQTIGAILKSMKDRAGLNLDQIAARCGYARKSSIQEYFKESYTGPIGTKAAQKLADGLAGLGKPPISHEEITVLAEASPPTNASIINYEGSSLEEMRETIDVFGTTLGAEMIVDGEAIEQTRLNTGDIIERRPRPVMLNGKPNIYGLYVQGSSMEPAHDDGDFVVVQRGAPLSLNQDVVVYIRPKNEDDDGERATQVLIKRLVRRTAQYVELRQFSPDTTFRIPAIDVLRIDRVLKLKDVLS